MDRYNFGLYWYFGILQTAVLELKFAQWKWEWFSRKMCQILNTAPVRQANYVKLSQGCK